MDITSKNMTLNNKVVVFSLIITTVICVSTLINIIFSYRLYIETVTSNLKQVVSVEKSRLSDSSMAITSENNLSSSNNIEYDPKPRVLANSIHSTFTSYKETNVVLAQKIADKWVYLNVGATSSPFPPPWFSKFTELQINNQIQVVEYDGGFIAVARETNVNGDFFVASQVPRSEILKPFVESMFFTIITSILGIVICAYWLSRELTPLAKVLTEKVIYNKIIFEKAPIPFVVCDKHNLIININDAGQKLFKISKGKMFGTDFTTLVPNLSSGEKLQPAKTEKNESLMLEVFGEKLQVGEKTDVVYAIIDATEKIYLENVIQENMAKQAATIDCLEDGVVTFDIQGKIINANPAIEKIFGFLLGEVEGSSLNILFSNPNQYISFFEKLLKRYLEKDHKVTNIKEFTGHHKSGRTFPVEFTINDFTIGETLFFTGILRDISLRKKQEEELIAHKDKLQEMVHLATTEVSAIVKTAVNAIISIDSLGIVKIFNPAAEQMLGWKASEVVGKNVACLIPDISADAHNSYIQNFIETGETQVIGIGREVSAKRKDGSTFPAQLEIGWSKLPGEDHLFVAFMSDITKAKADRESLTVAKEQAETANRAKALFLANMSHEIRTPMNAIIGFSEIMLEDNGLSEIDRDNLSTVYGAAKSLLTIINDILDFSKVEAKKLKIEKVSFHLPNLLKDVEKIFEYKAIEKGLIFNIQIDDKLTEGVIGDPSRLKQILLNLIGNAIKFTSKGKVRLSVEPTEDQRLVLFTVRDTGIGMTAEQTENIFSPFSQADSSTARKYGGTGLGTTISLQLVELMNGWIWVDSELDVGTTFSFVIELEPHSIANENSTDLELEQQRHFDSVYKNKALRILLAEDVDANAKLILRRFSKSNSQIEWVQDGKAAVEENSLNDYDIVLMDVQMPEMDGIEATKRIREANKNNNVPIVALTASVLHEERQQCLDAGMNEVVGKPIDFTELINVINDLVNSHTTKHNVGSVSNEARDSVHHASYATLLNKVINYEAAINLWQCEDVYIETLLDFVDLNSTTAKDFIEYLSVEPVNTESALQLAHKIKGASANLKIKAIPDLMAKLEKALHANEIEHAKSLVSFFETGLSKINSALSSFMESTNGKLNPDVSVNVDRETEEVLDELNNLLQKFDPEPVEPLLELLKGKISDRDYEKLTDAVARFDFIDAQLIVSSIYQFNEYQE